MKTEKKSPEQAAEERKAIERLTTTINGMISGVLPKDHNNWSYQRAVDFKAAVRKAASEVKKQRKSLSSLHSTLSMLKNYYQ